MVTDFCTSLVLFHSSQRRNLVPRSGLLKYLGGSWEIYLKQQFHILEYRKLWPQEGFSYRELSLLYCQFYYQLLNLKTDRPEQNKVFCSVLFCQSLNYFLCSLRRQLYLRMFCLQGPTALVGYLTMIRHFCIWSCALYHNRITDVIPIFPSCAADQSVTIHAKVAVDRDIR